MSLNTKVLNLGYNEGHLIMWPLSVCVALDILSNWNLFWLGHYSGSYFLCQEEFKTPLCILHAVHESRHRGLDAAENREPAATNRWPPRCSTKHSHTPQTRHLQTVLPITTLPFNWLLDNDPKFSSLKSNPFSSWSTIMRALLLAIHLMQ